MRITFITSHRVQQYDGKGPLYEAGRTYDFAGPVAETYARKYIKLGLAAPETAAGPVSAETGGSGELSAAATLLAELEVDDGLRRNFAAFKARAADILGDATPARKADIIEALKAKAAAAGPETQPA